MADISQIAANGTTYDIKDATARSALNKKLYTITVSSFSAFPKTITDANITTDMVVLGISFSNPSAITSNISWSTNTAGKLVLSGTISGATTAVITLGRSEF